MATVTKLSIVRALYKASEDALDSAIWMIEDARQQHPDLSVADVVAALKALKDAVHDLQDGGYRGRAHTESA